MGAAELPIFPLANVVVFPGVQTPLHLFEPRYRQLGQEVVAGRRRLGMVVVPPEHTPEMEGNPPVYPIGCGGDVVQAQQLPNGRWNIVLAGTERFRIVSEEPPQPPRLYRTAAVEWLEDAYPEEARQRVAALRAAIVVQLRELVTRSGQGEEDRVPEEWLSGVDDAGFVNSLCNALSFAPAEKQGLLEAENIPERFERLEGLLAFRLADPGGGKPGSRSVH
ncbi:MAG: LON peptidase substrate-binding domain-containing protein [Myxococcota bacterium]|nr:LON peptidase substrate-binding domain-containing protein [Myxococcota bacterium]